MRSPGTHGVMEISGTQTDTLLNFGYLDVMKISYVMLKIKFVHNSFAIDGYMYRCPEWGIFWLYPVYLFVLQTMLIEDRKGVKQVLSQKNCYPYNI